MDTSIEYAELLCRTNFSFLEGASHPEEMVAQAKLLGLSALAITDRNGLSGIVRAHAAAKEQNLPLIIGSLLTIDTQLVAFLASSRKGYANLCRLISYAKQRPREDPVLLQWDEVARHQGDLFSLAVAPYGQAEIERIKEIFGDRFFISLQRTVEAADLSRSEEAKRLSHLCSIPIVAVNDAHYHASHRQPLQDVLTATRHGTTVQEAGYRLFSNAERRLKSSREMAKLFSDLPDAVFRTVEIAKQCHFSLDELRYIYPDEFLPPGITSVAYLEQLTWAGAKKRYSAGVPKDVQRQIEHELKLISELHFTDYFLTIYDIVMYARSREILCQGRGSAANSAVCYVLGITAIDPVRMNLLFERFISAERGEPPDIDVDFEHERREEVIQYIYQRYGRDRAGITAEVITYRSKSAVRDVVKALGGDVTSPKARELIMEIKGFPRHLSTHVGGFVLTRDPLIENVPIENTAMANRTIIQWDKNDLDALGMLKVDVLGLGMLTCIRKCFKLVNEEEKGPAFTLETVPSEDPNVYDMMGRADTVGVFQIESRAQMGMLPRLLPRTFFDLVVEVAIVRPGPIIGKMVHPYLRRRRGEETVHYPHPALKEILGKTFGVPLFQEQVMKIAIAVADFNPGEADQLRRAMGIWRTSKSATMISLSERLIAGMVRHGISKPEAQRIFDQIKSFGEFGFPESHSASFALLVYISAYLKCYYPISFACSLLNSQPMGFYAPHTIVDDLKRHGETVLPIDANRSPWDCSIENGALRLGFRLVRGLSEKIGRKIEEEREKCVFTSIENFVHRIPIHRLQGIFLVSAGAFDSLVDSRREAIWKLLSTPWNRNDLYAGSELLEEKAELPELGDWERVRTDYKMLGLSLFAHPVSLFRENLRRVGALTIEGLLNAPNGGATRLGGLVIVRQRPATAKGMVFLTLEDETGMVNVAVRPNLYEKFGGIINEYGLLLMDGKLQKDGRALSILAQHIQPFPNISTEAFSNASRDYH